MTLSTMGPTHLGLLALAGVSLLCGGAAATGVVAQLDIKAGGCPNPLNARSNGVLPVALLGSADFDVNDVDIDTIRLSRADGVGGSAAPNEGPPGPRTVVDDVGTPVNGTTCECHELEGDGINDLSMKFRTQILADALELDSAEREVELVLTANLRDGTPIEASDCVTLVPRSDLDGDGVVGLSDLIILIGSWGDCPATGDCPADIDVDGAVSTPDFLQLLGEWG